MFGEDQEPQPLKPSLEGLSGRYQRDTVQTKGAMLTRYYYNEFTRWMLDKAEYARYFYS